VCSTTKTLNGDRIGQSAIVMMGLEVNEGVNMVKDQLIGVFFEGGEGKEEGGGGGAGPDQNDEGGAPLVIQC